jgi:hypothetical protein
VGAREARGGEGLADVPDLGDVFEDVGDTEGPDDVDLDSHVQVSVMSL